MLSPFVICNGVIRSGSTWSFNVCRLLMELRAWRRGETVQAGYLDARDLEEFLRGEAFYRQGAAVYKSHGNGPLASHWIRTGKAKAVCTFRDPRDCVASDIEFMGLGFDASLRRVAQSLRLLDSYQDFGRTLFIRYEEMMEDRPAAIQVIAAHLYVRLHQKDLERIDEQTNISSSRKRCSEISSLRDDQVQPVEGTHRRHLTTLLHDNHIGTAKVGRWKQDLTDAQGRQLTHLFANTLLNLGYETQESIQKYLVDTKPAAPNAGRFANGASPVRQPTT
jgi:hypothetical protein